MKRNILEKVEKEISQLGVDEQKELLHHLPRLLKLPLDDILLLRASESSFAFWDNPDDRIYDNL